MNESDFEKARKKLNKLRLEGNTYQNIADRLSDQLDSTISGARVWKFLHGNNKSPEILKALNLYKTRHRVTAELRSKEKLALLKDKLGSLGISFSELANGIAEGKISIVIKPELKESNESISN